MSRTILVAAFNYLEKELVALCDKFENRDVYGINEGDIQVPRRFINDTRKFVKNEEESTENRVVYRELKLKKLKKKSRKTEVKRKIVLLGNQKIKLKALENELPDYSVDYIEARHFDKTGKEGQDVLQEFERILQIGKTLVLDGEFDKPEMYDLLEKDYCFRNTRNVVDENAPLELKRIREV